MKITFLGTAAGVPEPNRETAATLIECGGKLYLIDAGAPVVNCFLNIGVNLEDLSAVFVTHSHGDHIHGLVDLVRCVNIEKIFPTASVDYYLPEPSVKEAISDFFVATAGPIREDVNRFHVFSEGDIFNDGNIRVSAIPTAHMRSYNRPSYAFLVEGDGRRVVFSGDLSQHIAHLDIPSPVFCGVDLYVSELAHFTVEELKPYLSKMKLGRLIFNHTSIERGAEVAMLDESGEYPFPITLANDGDQIIL